MSDTKQSRSPTPSYKRTSRSPSRHRSVSRSRSRGRSYSRSPSPRKRSSSPYHRRRRSYSRSRSRSPYYSRHRRYRSYSRSRSHSYRSRSRSRSYSPYYSRRRSYRYRSRSRSPLSNRRRHDGNRYNPSPSKVLGVFGLSLYTGEKDLRDLFSKYGPISQVQVVYDHQTGRSRGFSFVYFEDVEDSIDAKEHCNGLELDGRRIRVDYSITKRPHTPTPGVYMGKPTKPSSRHYDDDYRYHDDDYHDRGYGEGRSYY